MGPRMPISVIDANFLLGIRSNMVQTRFSRGILPKKRYTEEVAIEGEEEEEFDQVMEEGSESEEELTGAKRKRGGKKKGKPAPGTKAKLAQRREEEESLGKEEEELVGESTGEAAEEGEGEEEQEEAVDVGPASKQPRVEEIAQEQGQEEEEEEAERLEEEGEEEQAGQQGGEMEQPAETEAAQEHEPQAAAPPAFAELQESEGAEEGAEALPVMPEAEQQAPVGGAEQVSEQAEPEQGGFVGAEAAQGATEPGAAVEAAQQEEIQASPAKPAEAAEEHEQGGGGGAAATEEKKEEQEVPTIESGKLMFFYRPKVGVEEAESMSQVQRFYMVFLPERPGSKPRLAVVGKKRLPAVDRHERFFGFIEAVADSVEALTADLGPKTYETKTRGTRTLAAARALGEASYAIVDKSAGSGSATGRTHLVLHLEAPEQPGEVQAEFELPKEGSYVLQVKNPANQPPQGQIGLTEKAEFPKEKLEEFKDYAWIGALDPSLLEYERAEFLLVAASDQPKEELGGSAAELAGGVDSDEAALNLLKEEANVEKAGIDMQPVQTGEWA